MLSSKLYGHRMYMLCTHKACMHVHTHTNEYLQTKDKRGMKSYTPTPSHRVGDKHKAYTFKMRTEAQKLDTGPVLQPNAPCGRDTSQAREQRWPSNQHGAKGGSGEAGCVCEAGPQP